MNKKTPVSVLTEFCAQNKVPLPEYESVNQDRNPNVFEILVYAFKIMAKGSGRSKCEAKHAASQALLDLLAKMEPHKSKLGNLNPPSPIKKANVASTMENSSIQNDDVVGTLINLCHQLQLQSPCFDEVSVTGESHLREFTFGCRLGLHLTYGCGFTKKDAKKKAASEMLKLIKNGVVKVESTDDSFNTTSSDNSDGPVNIVLPVLEVPTVDEILAEYRRLARPYIQPIENGLRNRRNFFLKLPAEKRRYVEQLLSRNRSYRSSQEIVSDCFKAMEIGYEIKSMAKPLNFKRFCITDVKYDCVIIAQSDELYEKVIDYLKTMFNLQKVEDLSLPGL